ncbi:MAG: ABC transporter permease subunit [Alphaproteobacteria bacterium]|nr:ABC transporter permease subunit [Alphaproteobacteria bacterium]
MGALGLGQALSGGMAGRRHAGGGVAAMLAPALALLILGYAAPMGAIAWTSLHRGGTMGLAAYAEVLGSPTFFRILGGTLQTAAVVTLLCVVLGYPFAYLVATRGRRHAGLLLALVAVPYLTSILIRSYAWIAILGGNGLVNRTLLALALIDEPLPLVFNAMGSYIGMVHVLLPMVVLPIYAAMRRIDPALPLAARNLGASSPAVFATVYLPLSAPGLAAGGVLVFLSALGFYITPALLGAPNDYLLAQAIEVRVAVLAEFDTAAAQACVLLALVGGLMLLFRRRIAGLAEGEDIVAAPERTRAGAGLRRRTLGAMLQRAPRLRALLAALADRMGACSGPALWTFGLLLLAFLLAPIVVVALVAFSSAPYLAFPPPGLSLRWVEAFLDDRRWLEAAAFSLAASLVAAATAVAVATPLAFALARRRFRGRQFLWLLAVSPMIVPHIVIGLGLFFTFVTVGLNGHPASFWIAYTVTGIPYVVIIMLSALRRLDVDLERAAASLGAHPLATLRTVTLPLLAVAIVSAFLFAFLTAFDDLVIALFLSSPRGTTLAMRMWEDIRLEISPKTAVVGVLEIAVLVATMLGTALVQRLRRTGYRAA